MPRALLPIVIAAALLVACTGGDDRPTSAVPTQTPVVMATVAAPPVPSTTPSTPSTPEPSPATALGAGLPPGVVGPLVVYARVSRTEQSEQRMWTTWAITSYDIGTRRVVAEFEIGEVGERADPVGLNGRELLVRLNQRLVALDLAGRELRTVHAVAADQLMPDPLISPDGSMLVFTELRDGCARFCVVVIDAASGDELLSVPQSAVGLATLGGTFPQPRAWRDDGRGVVVVGQPNGHRLFGIATVSLDGSVRSHEIEALFGVSPNGRRLVTFEDEIDLWRIDGLGCEVYGALGLRDLDSDRVLSIIGREGWRIGRLTWSPGGGQLLVALLKLPEPGGSCSQRFEEFDDAPVEWLLVDAETGVVTRIEDADAVDALWLDEPRPSLLCQGVESNVGAVRAFRCTDADGDTIDADLIYGGSYVGSGDRLWVPGVIEVASTPEPPPPSVALTPEPFPTSVVHVPFVDGLPVGVSGPLVGYSGQVGAELTRGRSWRVIEVAAFDLDGERPISSFRVGGVGNYPLEWLLVGHEVLFNLEHTLVAYYLDGSISRVVRGGGDAGLRFHSVLLSPDGTTIVFAESGAPECGALACLVFLDVTTGDEVRVFPTDPVLAELGGQFAQPVTWLGDGSGVVVRGQPNGHAFAGTATVMLDGSVLAHPGLRGGDVAPGGRFFLERGEFVESWIADELGCSLYSDLTIFDLDAGTVVATVATPGLAIRHIEWSPDGGELLYGARTLPDPERGSCSTQYRAWAELPYAWRLLDVGSNTSAPADDPQAVRDRWAGEHVVRFNCAGELVETVDTNDRRYFRCFDAEGERIAAALEVDGIAVAVGPHDRVFGFVELAGR